MLTVKFLNKVLIVLATLGQNLLNLQSRSAARSIRRNNDAMFAMRKAANRLMDTNKELEKFI